jgi:FkbM family methyltransferase
MGLVKSILKRTFVHGLVRRRRLLAEASAKASSWTAHDRQMTQFYSQFVSAGDLCFDVGANIGNRVKIFLKLGARVIAIEPQAECASALRKVYRGDRRVTVIQKALGESICHADMMIGNRSVVSSMSPEWIQSLTKSGRLTGDTWDRRQSVSVTTLDTLIEQEGVPAFIKIDVEGFEYHVMMGLSRPPKALSFEFHPEFMEVPLKCAERLRQMGAVCWNYSLGESMQLALEHWVASEEIVPILMRIRAEGKSYGDLYARLNGS